MAAPQLGVARIGGERFGEFVGLGAVDQGSGDAGADEVGAPVASAAITGSAQAIASSVTLPNASVIDGLKKTSALASARARSSPVCWPSEDRFGQLLLEPWPCRALRR